MWRFLRNRRLLLCLHTIFRALIYWAHRAVILAIAWHLVISGVKDYSNWPTIPQIYINGEFIGGCDIMIELHQKGELVEELKKAGIASALSGTSKQL